MGKKRVRRRLFFLAGIMLIFVLEHASLRIFASDGEPGGDVRIEGVTALMPDISIYCYPAGQELLENVTASYGEEELTVSEVLPYQEAGEGSDYYILLDISGSFSGEYFNCMKACILQIKRAMSPLDKMTLLTFGDEVRVVFEDKAASDDIEGLLQPLENTDQTTHLFEAIHQTAELADTKPKAGVRKIALAFTDGEDFSENSSTKQEALAALNEKQIPLYAMASREIYQGGSNTYLDGMGEFVRACGGAMKIFDTTDALGRMQEMQDLFAGAYVIRAKAKTNVVDYKNKLLTATFSNGKTKSLEYKAAYYKEGEKEVVASAKKISSSAIRITFSGPVKNAGNTSAYEIIRDSETLTDGYMVRYENGEESFAEIMFEEELLNGAYEIKIHGVKEDSMEKKSVGGALSFEVTDGKKPGIKDYLIKYQVLIAVFAVTAVLMSAAAVTWRIIKKRKGVVTIEGKAVLKANTAKKHHISVQKKEIRGRQIQFGLEGVLDNKEITVEVLKSMIVGRSQICDISIDDEKMSRQHFAIHDKNGAFFIEDLHTTNGTMVNGRKVTVVTKLSPGDQIKVGDIAMTVRWRHE